MNMRSSSFYHKPELRHCTASLHCVMSSANLSYSFLLVEHFVVLIRGKMCPLFSRANSFDALFYCVTLLLLNNSSTYRWYILYNCLSTQCGYSSALHTKLRLVKSLALRCQQLARYAGWAIRILGKASARPNGENWSLKACPRPFFC